MAPIRTDAVRSRMKSQPRHLVEVDDRRGCGQPEVHHRNEVSAAGEEAALHRHSDAAVRAQLDRTGAVIFELRRLHL